MSSRKRDAAYPSTGEKCKATDDVRSKTSTYKTSTSPVGKAFKNTSLNSWLSRENVTKKQSTFTDLHLHAKGEIPGESCNNDPHKKKKLQTKAVASTSKFRRSSSLEDPTPSKKEVGTKTWDRFALLNQSVNVSNNKKGSKKRGSKENKETLAEIFDYSKVTHEADSKENTEQLTNYVPTKKYTNDPSVITTMHKGTKKKTSDRTGIRKRESQGNCYIKDKPLKKRKRTASEYADVEVDEEQESTNKASTKRRLKDEKVHSKKSEKNRSHSSSSRKHFPKNAGLQSSPISAWLTREPKTDKETHSDVRVNHTRQKELHTRRDSESIKRCKSDLENGNKRGYEHEQKHVCEGESKKIAHSSTKLDKYEVKNHSKNKDKLTWLNKHGSEENEPTSKRTKSRKKSRKHSDHRSTSEARNMMSPKIQRKLDDLFNEPQKHTDTHKKSKKSKVSSRDSCDFPSFTKYNKKIDTDKNDEIKKYGMVIPSLDEILREKEDLETYKNQIESLAGIEEKTFELPFSVTELNVTQHNYENVLGCKHLTSKDIDEAFQRNLEYISGIFNGEKYSERHDKFFNNNNKNSLTTKDLTYSTSTIVFDFEQKEHMLTLLKKNFDPEDNLTQYFFQVLLPELCLKIFMDTHKMTYDEAVRYLDTRPIIDD